MKMFSIALAASLAASPAMSAHASAGPGSIGTNSLPDAPGAEAVAAAHARPGRLGLARDTHLYLVTEPFSAIAVSFTTGLAGLGFQVATPLAAKINLRGGVSFLSVSPAFTSHGTQIIGQVAFRTVNAAVDLYPYRNSFHFSPGITVYNGNRINVVANIPPGQSFTFDDTTYTSSTYDPVHGSFSMSMGHKVAPSFTVGWGNMLRRDTHWSIPTEFGVQYIGTPGAKLFITGTSCDPVNGCTQLQTDPDTQQSIAQEQASLNKDLSLLRLYPIMSVGLSYRFGHNKEMSPWR
jgi:hypothetical protein